MPIIFHPKAGTVLMCDFTGFKKPEMIKTRPVIVVSPNHLKRPGLYTVVPMSTTDPDPIELYHYRFKKNPMPHSNGHAWAKCDMVVTVSMERLDRIKVSRGNYVVTYISNKDLEAIRECMKHALGIID
jgi:uncharacterized protein YifN (PemK superfamily)